MKSLAYDVVVIGGGPAGMAAACKAAKKVQKVLIIERNDSLGGVLNQCIHTGFGLHCFGENLTGPEFADLQKDKVSDLNIDVNFRVKKGVRNGQVMISSGTQILWTGKAKNYKPSVMEQLDVPAWILKQAKDTITVAKFAQEEVTCPKRVLTSTVLFKDGDAVKLLPVRTDKAVPLSRYEELMDIINKICVDYKIVRGAILVEKIAGLEANLISSATAPKV